MTIAIAAIAAASSKATNRDIMSAKEKEAAAQQTFVAKHVEEAPVTRPLTFHKPLTNEPSASADSRARQRGVHESEFKPAGFGKIIPLSAGFLLSKTS